MGFLLQRTKTSMRVSLRKCVKVMVKSATVIVVKVSQVYAYVKLIK
jgi:hypothetical protein